MIGNPNERCKEIARYIIKTQATVRVAAKKFGVCKSIVYNDVAYRLKRLDPILHEAVSLVLAKNKAERHIRGGMVTAASYFTNNSR